MTRNCGNTNSQGMTCQRNMMGKMPAPAMAGNAPKTNSCGQASGSTWNVPSVTEEIPNGCQADLLRYISEVSFAAYDALLYLDTHPCCQEALQYFQTYNALRNRALRLHAQSYGPLTLATAAETGCSSWEWTTQPWPWELEGGAC